MFFSVIIPFKNSKDTIKWCVQSVINQNFPKDEYEIICVDNGSTDGSVSILEKYKDNLRIIESGADTVSGVRNDGARVSNGEILAFLDSDCIVPAWWLKEAKRILTSHNVVACGGEYDVNIGLEYAILWKNIHGYKSDGFVNWLPSGNLFVKRDIFISLGGFDEYLISSEDVDFCIRLNNSGNKIYFSKELNVVHLGEPKNMIDFFNKERWRGKGVLKLCLKHKGRIGLKPLFLAVYTLAYVILSIVFLLWKSKLGFLFLLLGFVPFIILAFKHKEISFLNKLRLSLLYFIYGLARAIAVV